MWNKLFKCSCHTHGIVLSHDWDEEDDPHFSIDVCIWSWGFDEDNRPGIRDRLRCAWCVIKKGHPYGDQTIIGLETAKELRDELDNLIEVGEKSIEKIP